jgi:hypothetical protein
MAFRILGDIENTCYDIDTLINQIDRLARQEGGQFIPAQDLKDRLREVRRILGAACPHEVCSCNGNSDGHEKCSGRGWVPISDFLLSQRSNVP